MSDRSATMIQAVVRGWILRKPKRKRKRVRFNETVRDNEGETRPLKRVSTSDFFKSVIAKGIGGTVTSHYVKELLPKVKQEDMTDKDAAYDLLKVVIQKSDKLNDAIIENKRVSITSYNLHGGSTMIVDNILRSTRDKLIEV